MKLADYLREHGLTQRVFAGAISKRLGRKIPQQTIGYVCGGGIPKRDLGRAIFFETDGAVQPNDFYDLTPSQFAVPAPSLSEATA